MSELRVLVAMEFDTGKAEPDCRRHVHAYPVTGDDPHEVENQVADDLFADKVEMLGALAGPPRPRYPAVDVSE